MTLHGYEESPKSIKRIVFFLLNVWVSVCWTAVSSMPSKWSYGTVDGRELVHEASVQPSSQALLSRGRRPHCCLIQKGCWFLLSRTGGAVHTNASMLRFCCFTSLTKASTGVKNRLKMMMCWRGRVWIVSTHSSGCGLASFSTWSSDILCRRLIGTLGSSNRYSTKTNRPPSFRLLQILLIIS